MSFKTLGFEINDVIYQKAIQKANGERKTLNGVISELVTDYAQSFPAPVVVPTPTAQRTYIVQSGDTLASIALQIYGKVSLYHRILEANNISDPRQLWIGQSLIIPTGNGATPVQPTIPLRPVPSSPPPPPSGQGQNPKPYVVFESSPNFNNRPSNEISAIIIHATANSSLNGVIAWFRKPTAYVSSHYTIGKDGTIVQHVLEKKRAWHAGKSSWQGRNDLNSWAVGIELVNLNNGADPYPEPQHQANVALCAYLCEKYNINTNFILGHYDIAPRRKTDPRGYDLNRLRQEVASRL